MALCVFPFWSILHSPQGVTVGWCCDLNLLPKVHELETKSPVHQRWEIRPNGSVWVRQTECSSVDERYYTLCLWEEACSLFYCVGYMSSLSSHLMWEAATSADALILNFSF